MWEKLISAAAAVAVPALGLLLRASTRNRLRSRIDEYFALADQCRPHDPAVATQLEGLASECAQQLILRDRRALRRKIDPAAIFAVVFLVAPAVALIVWAFSWDSGWKWAAITFAAIWIVVWAIAGTTQLWQERTDLPDTPHQAL